MNVCKPCSKPPLLRSNQRRQQPGLLLLPVSRLAALAVLLLLLLAAVEPSSAQRNWDDDGGGSTWNSNSDWAGGQQTWNSRGGAGGDTRSAGSSDASIAPTPNGPAQVRDSGGSSVRNPHGSKLKKSGPQQGFSGGFLPRTSRCTNPNLPGCQSCNGDLCTSCYDNLGDASFVLSEETHQCLCPPGYGMIAEGDLPEWWGRRRLQQETSTATAAASNSTDSSVQLLSSGSGAADGTTTLQQQDMEGQEQLLATTLAFPTPPPPWATACLPCPVNFFSPGGPVGFTQCQRCPDQWTTGNASASADCMVPYCGAGREVNRRTGHCRTCPFGSYRPANAANLTCTVCPRGFTTPARGSTSFADCRVPICPPGSQLNIDLFICKTCTGNSISPGGTRANGPYQPFCQECPTFTAAVNGTACFQEACPPPDAFRIECRSPDQLPSCGPGSKPVKLDDLCTAFPIGTQLQWVRATIEVDASGVPIYGGISSNFTVPAVAECPAGATGTTVWWPQITSFMGRTGCLCTTDTSCRFIRQGQGGGTGSTFQVENFNASINVTLPDPQLRSLREMLFSIGRSSYTKFGARLGGYCSGLDSARKNFMETSCLGPYLTSMVYRAPIFNSTYMLLGQLPTANLLSGLSHLQRFGCAGCMLNGSLPADWGTSNNLQALTMLDLGTNQFTGILPVSWGGLVNLANLTLSTSQNIVPADVPSYWGNMRSLAYANLTNVRLRSSSCVPSEWKTWNGLVQGVTLFTSGQTFC